MDFPKEWRDRLHGGIRSIPPGTTGPGRRETRVEGDSGSTVPRRQLGRFLRQHREAAGFTVKGAAHVLECSFQKVWRIEKGAVPVRGTDVRLLCDAYRVVPQMAEALVGLARETRAKGWWQSYGDAVPDWFELYVGLEGAANRIRKWEPSLAPGLLQAHAYMASVILADRPGLAADDVERRVALRQERQGLLSRRFPAPPRLEVIVWEPVLRARPDHPGAMTQQLAHLLAAGAAAHISVRVLPLALGPHRASVSGAFTILEFPAGDGGKGEPATVYSESLTGALYLDKPRELAVYRGVWADLSDQALTEEESADLIRTIGENDHE